MDDDLPHLDAVERVLTGALALKAASLVIFRRGLLVEFKTELLTPAIERTQEGRYRSWQLGPYDGHHCHLDLASVEKVWFDAEPVSCQGGRLNYTVWFLAAGDCGNPYRADGLFSITLNAPYRADGSARSEAIRPVYLLHAKHERETVVSASPAFVSAGEPIDSRPRKTGAQGSAAATRGRRSGIGSW